MATKDPNLEDIKQALGIFAEAVVDTLHHRHDDNLEPFEAYELYLREQVYNNSDEFKERFIRGYFTLTDAVDNS